MPITRDTQRSKVYEAESLVRTMFDRADERGLRTVDIAGSMLTLPIERKFASIESVQTYTDAVLRLEWVREAWPSTGAVHVRERAGATASHYEARTGTIAVPLHRGNKAWALRELVVLHELAHHLGGPDNDHDDQQPAHSGAFVDRFITLVTEIVGHEAGFLLRAMMLESGVRIG